MKQRNSVGKFSKSAIWVDRTCENCGKLFKIKESSIKYGRGRCCSRSCVDENKRKNVGTRNGMFGRSITDEHKKRISNSSRALWKSATHRKHVHDKLSEFVARNGYFPGTSAESKKKRAITCMSKYGVSHVWKSPTIRAKTDETCVKLYGKTSTQLMNEALSKCNTTGIERKILSILDKNGIHHIPKFTVPYGDSYKEYDVFIPKANLLIEADGDYWHANPSMFRADEINPIQQMNVENDIIKTELAKRDGFILIRFWESDINQDTFESVLLNKLHEIL